MSFVFGMLLGDFGRGGAAMIGVRTVLQSSYSRKPQSAADAYGAPVVRQIAGDPGAILLRGAGRPGAFTNIRVTHSEANDRAIAIDALAGAPAGEDPTATRGATTHPAGRKP